MNPTPTQASGVSGLSGETEEGPALPFSQEPGLTPQPSVHPPEQGGCQGPASRLCHDSGGPSRALLAPPLGSPRPWASIWAVVPLSDYSLSR